MSCHAFHTTGMELPQPSVTQLPPFRSELKREAIGV